MSLFGNLRTQWKMMSRKKKVQVIVNGICDIGADLLAGMMLGHVVPDNTHKWKKAAMVVTAGGLGMAAGDLAAKRINDTMDIFWKDEEDLEDE